ncbi:hypothetical protein ABPG75_004384 [Micractinium tetrahymenae]
MQSFTELAAFQKAVESHRLAVVHFWAAWCEPCKLLDQVLAQLAADSPAVAALRVEAEEAADISERYSVSVVPYFLFFKDGKVVDSLEGADAAALTTKFNALAAGGAGAAAAAPAAAAAAPAPAAPSYVEPAAGGDLQARLRQLVNQQPIMLFMKGSPDAPRCGFSRKVVEALRSCGAQFGSFDILSDEAVRQGLKEFSQWPTYPQVYVNGELLGGCDIVLEMHEAGELQGELANARQAGDDPKAALRQRLERLVNQQPVMLFMKGNPEAPRCGFSRKVAEALRSAGEEFGSFDILSDEAVRQGLKEFSNWPTYPQVYVKGELLGGCDIVLEMQEAGELKDTIEEMKARM